MNFAKIKRESFLHSFADYALNHSSDFTLEQVSDELLRRYREDNKETGISAEVWCRNTARKMMEHIVGRWYVSDTDVLSALKDAETNESEG